MRPTSIKHTFSFNYITLLTISTSVISELYLLFLLIPWHYFILSQMLQPPNETYFPKPIPLCYNSNNTTTYTTSK